MKRNLSFISSLSVVISYLVFAVLSLLSFPTSYSPVSNWLSDLGNSQLNPGGAIFYNTGIVLAGISLLIFFLGLSEWTMAGNKKQNIMLFLTRIFGILGSLSMVLSAIFPINLEGIHSFWSTSLYILIGTSFGFSVAALRYYVRYPRWMLILGIVVALEDMFWGMVMNIYIMEFITVILFLLYTLLLGIVTKRKAIYVG
jgi:hypothetical protein